MQSLILGFICVVMVASGRLIRIWALQDVFGSLKARCDSSHVHKPWPGVVDKQLRFRTVEESVYPSLFCHRLLSSVAVRLGLPCSLPNQLKALLYRIKAREWC